MPSGPARAARRRRPTLGKQWHPRDGGHCDPRSYPRACSRSHRKAVGTASAICGVANHRRGCGCVPRLAGHPDRIPFPRAPRPRTGSKRAVKRRGAAHHRLRARCVWHARHVWRAGRHLSCARRAIPARIKCALSGRACSPLACWGTRLLGACGAVGAHSSMRNGLALAVHRPRRIASGDSCAAARAGRLRGLVWLAGWGGLWQVWGIWASITPGACARRAGGGFTVPRNAARQPAWGRAGTGRLSVRGTHACRCGRSSTRSSGAAAPRFRRTPRQGLGFVLNAAAAQHGLDAWQAR